MYIRRRLLGLGFLLIGAVIAAWILAPANRGLSQVPDRLPSLQVQEHDQSIGSAASGAMTDATPPTSGHNLPKGPGAVRGQVYSIDGMREAGLEIYAICRTPAGSTGETVAVTQSSDAGEFAFHYLPLGSYILTARTHNAFASARVSLSERTPEDEVRLILYPGGVISGIVSNSTGKPIAQAKVSPCFHNGDEIGSTTIASLTVLTDEEGRFALPGLESTTWQFFVSAEGFAPLTTPEVNVGTEDLKLILTSGLAVAGIVADGRSDLPVPGVTVLSTQSDVGTPPVETESREDGTFTFPALNLGLHEFDVSHPVYVSETGPVTVDVKHGMPEVQLRVAVGGEVQGRVLDAMTETGVEGVEVVALPDSNGATSSHALRSRASRTRGPQRTSNPTDSAGAFVIRGLSSGPYLLSVPGRIPGYLSANGAGGTASVQVAPGETSEGVVIYIDRGIVVEGQTVDVEGRPISNANILMDGDVLPPGGGTQTTSDVYGNFALTGLKPDQEITLTASTAVATSHIIGPIVIGDEGVSGLRVVLGLDRNALIAGTVVTARGLPIQVKITAWNEDLPFPGFPTIEWSSEQGQFVLAGLSEGVYSLMLEPQGGVQKLGGTVRLAAGQEARGVRLVYEAEALLTISGRVVDEEGQPVQASIRCHGIDESSLLPATFGRSRRDGSFEIGNLEPGSYVLQPEAAGYQSEMLQAEAGMTGIELVVARNSTGELRGHVINTSGAPVTQFEIAVFAAGEAPVFRSVNDSEGRFELVGAVGTCSVRVRAKDYRPYRNDDIAVTASKPVELAITLKPGNTPVDIIVVDMEGKAVAGAYLYENTLPDNADYRPEYALGRTNSNGIFRWDSAPSEPTLIWAYHRSMGNGSGQVTAREGAVASAQIVVSAKGRIEGTVTSTSLPADRFDVIVSSDAGGQVAVVSPQKDGSFTINNLSAGLYTLEARPSSGQSVTSASAFAQAEVADGEVTHVNVQFP